MPKNEYDPELESAQESYPLLSSKVLSILGSKHEYMIDSIAPFVDSEGNEKPSFILTDVQLNEVYKYVPNKTAQDVLKKLGFVKFNDVVGKIMTIEVIQTKFEQRPTLGLMVHSIE